jgi:hypothetical protein
MDDETFKSLQQVLEYMEDEELRDWISQGYPYDHIFNHVRRVKVWAAEQPKGERQ